MSVIERQPAELAFGGATPAQSSEQRTLVVWVLIDLSCALVVLGTIAVGVQQLLLNTDRWVSPVGP